MPARVGDPFGNFNFIVEIDGIGRSGFREVILPAATANVIEYREGNDANTVRKLPGLVKYGNLTLKAGITESRDLYDWWNTVREGRTERRSMSVILLDESRNEVKRWNFQNAWPVRYQPSALDARGSEVVIEILEIAHEGMELV